MIGKGFDILVKSEWITINWLRYNFYFYFAFLKHEKDAIFCFFI
jgi:hypothetical protein